MPNKKVFLVSIVRSGLGFIPIFFAPMLIGEREVLIDFYRFLIIFSLISSVSILGLINYIFIINSGFFTFFKKKNLWTSIAIFKITSIFLFIVIIFIGFYVGEPLKYLDYALLVPLGVFLYKQQVSLARKKYKQFVINLGIPVLIFIMIIFGIRILGPEKFYLTTSIVLSISCLFFFNSYNLEQVYKIYVSAYMRKSFIRYLKHLVPYIGNGLLLALTSPLISLALIDVAASTGEPIAEVSSYFIYYRIFDGLVGFLVGYLILLKNEKNNIYLGSNLIKYLFILIILFFTVSMVNYSVYISTGFYDVYICLMELAIAFMKLMLALMAYNFLIKYPLLGGLRELLFYAFLLSVQFIIQPATIIDFQIYILSGFIVSYLCSLIFINKSLRVRSV